MRKACGSIPLLLLLVVAGYAIAAEQGEEAKLRFAAAQHEIIAILIKEEQFDRVLPEFSRIVELGFEGPTEELVVKETWAVVDGLMAAAQFEIAHQVIDQALDHTAESDSEFGLLMLKGKLYRQEGRLREALQTYRLAQGLQQ